MNEPANFGTNEERPVNWPPDVKPYWSLKCYGNKYDDPPYKTGKLVPIISLTNRYASGMNNPEEVSKLTSSQSILTLSVGNRKAQTKTTSSTNS